MTNINIYPPIETLTVGDTITVGGTTKVWDGEKWANQSFGNHEKRLQKDRQAIEALYKSQGYNNVYFFEDGFTYAEENDVGVYSDGTAWTYADAGALPVTIAAGTIPSEGIYNKIIYGKTTPKYVETIEAISAMDEVGTRYYLVDRGCSATVVSGKVADGFFIIDSGSNQIEISPLNATATPVITPRMAGAKVSTANNAPHIQAAYNYASSNGFTLLLDALYPTTETVDFSSTAMQVKGVGRGVWRDLDGSGSTVGGILYSGPGDAITCGNGSQKWGDFKVRCQGSSSSCIHFNGVAATLMDLEYLRLQNTGSGDGILITGNNGGESLRCSRVESSGHSSALRLDRLDTQCNNMLFDKVNFHRNEYGFKFDSGVQRLAINNTSDITLNSVAGVAFLNNVDSDSIIENNWFENNGIDILLNCDSPARTITTRNNKLAEATIAAVRCQNGRIISTNDKINSTPIGFLFDVSDFRSKISLGSSTNVAELLSGDISNVSVLPSENAKIREYHFAVEDIPANWSANIPVAGGLGGFFAPRLNSKSSFLSVDIQLNGVSVSSGSCEFTICKNTAANTNNYFKPVIDSGSGFRVKVDSLLGNNQFSSSSDFDNFFIRYNTSSDWDGITGSFYITVTVIENNA